MSPNVQLPPAVEIGNFPRNDTRQGSSHPKVPIVLDANLFQWDGNVGHIDRWTAINSSRDLERSDTWNVPLMLMNSNGEGRLFHYDTSDFNGFSDKLEFTFRCKTHDLIIIIT